MNGDQSESVRFPNAELSVKEIRLLTESNPQCRSGVIGVDDKLEMVSYRLLNCQLNEIQLPAIFADMASSHVKAAIVFNIISDNKFESNKNINNKLALACELHNIDLIDVILIGYESWVSLRQHNRL
jgi:hypothetical protein